MDAEVQALRVGFDPDPGAVLQFCFETLSRPGMVAVACPRLAGPSAPESWAGPDGSLKLLVFRVPERDGDVAAAARAIYSELVARVRGSSHPHLMRIWNHMDAINVGEGDQERYRRFCLGREIGADRAFNQSPAAATAIGHAHVTGHVHVIVLCSREAPQTLESPRQIPAWRYPRTYGPASPGFARGALFGKGANCRLLASGTAAIVGHQSMHIGDAPAQLRETLANIQALLELGSTRSGQAFRLAEPEAFRVYLREPGDLDAARAIIAETGMDKERVVYLHGDIARRELLVEVEGVFAPC